MSHDEFEHCYICLESIDNHTFNDNKFLICGCLNRYHNQCIETWYKLHNKCPICKKIMNQEEDLSLAVDDYDIFYPKFMYNILFIGCISLIVYFLGCMYLIELIK